MIEQHSSFFAMVGVADQFAQLRGVLGQVLGLFGLLRWLKALLRGEATPSMSDEFRGYVVLHYVIAQLTHSSLRLDS